MRLTMRVIVADRLTQTPRATTSPSPDLPHAAALTLFNPPRDRENATSGRSDVERVMTVAGQAITRAGSLYSIGVASVVPFALREPGGHDEVSGDRGLWAARDPVRDRVDPDDPLRAGRAPGHADASSIARRMRKATGTATALGDDGAAPLDLDPEQIELSVTEKHRLLGSGLLLIMLSATLWCAPVALLSPIVADVFLGSTSWTSAVLLMTASAWTGGVWRLAHQIWRTEYRPIVWCLFQALRPLLVVSGTIVALASGLGIEGVLISTAAGTMLATLISMFCSRRLFFFRPRLEDAPRIIKAGLPMVPVVIARLIQSNVSILLLALIAPATAVGLFQVASRIAMIPSYFASGFLLGWLPLNRSPIGKAGKQLRGRAGYGGRVFTLLVLILIAVTVVTGLGAGLAIRIAAPSFGDAADLIPIVALGAAMSEVFHAYYRASKFHARRWWYTALLFIWLFPYVLMLWIGSSLSPRIRSGREPGRRERRGARLDGAARPSRAQRTPGAVGPPDRASLRSEPRAWRPCDWGGLPDRSRPPRRAQLGCVPAAAAGHAPAEQIGHRDGKIDRVLDGAQADPRSPVAPTPGNATRRRAPGARAGRLATLGA